MTDIHKENIFYQQQCNDLGKRILRLQRENTQILRDRNRSRVLARLIGRAHQETINTDSADEVTQRFLKTLIVTLNVDRVILFSYMPEKGYFIPISYLGFENKVPQRINIQEIPCRYCFVNSKSTINPSLDFLRQMAGVPHLLWSFNPVGNVALLVGNITEDQRLHTPFQEKDRELIEGALNVYLDITERKLSEERLHRRDAILEAVSFAAQLFMTSSYWERYVSDILKRIGQAVSVNHAYVFPDKTVKDLPVSIAPHYEWTDQANTDRENSLKYTKSLSDIFCSPRWMDRFRQGKAIWGNLSEFNESEQSSLTAAGIKSIFVTPIFREETLWGWMGFHDSRSKHEWSSAEREALNLAARNFGALLHRDRIEKSIRRNEEKYRLIAENISDIVWTMDQDLKPTFVSPSIKFILGYTTHEAMGTPLEKILTPSSYKKILNVIRDVNPVVAENKYHPRPIEIEMMKKDGSIVSCEATNLPLLSENNQLIGFIGVTRDISQRKKFEAEIIRSKEIAEQANEAKSEFLANMSHELRTPLNHIIGFTEMVVDKHFGDLNENQEEFLNDALSSSKHLLALINDILDISKVEAGKQSVKLEKINLATQLDNGLLMVKEKTINEHIDTSVQIDGCPEYIWADQRKFKQILYNLLSNAVKFTPIGGKIKIFADHLIQSDNKLKGHNGSILNTKIDNGKETASHKTYIGISVRDNGIGISAENLEKVFQPFMQIESSASKKYQGTGLGLALVKQFVELHGGKVWAESRGLGNGSAVTFILPNY